MLSHFLSGYCRLLIYGGELEQFINLATQRNINIWNIRNLESGVLSVEISLRSLKAARYVAQATGCSLQIFEKRGLPVAWRNLCRQKSFVIGVFIGLLLLFLFSQSIFRVEVLSEKTLTKAEKSKVLEISASHGIKPYAFAWNLDWQAAAEDILKQTDGYSWVGYEKSGVLVRVRLVKKDTLTAENSAPGNVVAAKDGVIREIFVYKGQKKVEANDTVQAGELLISGMVEPAETGAGNTYSVHPEGLVRGSVWYEATASCNVNELQPQLTGNHGDYIALYWQAREYLLWGAKENSFADYKETVSEHLLGPLRLAVVRREERAPKEGGYSQEQAQHIALLRAKAQVLKEISPGAFIIKEETFPVTSEGDIVTLRLVVETYEDLGTFISAETTPQ